MAKETDGRRVARVAREVQQTIAQFLIAGFKNPLPGLVTVARVIMPADFRTAKVYVSVLGSDDQRTEALEILNKRTFEVQKFIGQELRMRYCPKLTFFLDDTTEQLMKIDRILHDLEKERQSKAGTQEPEEE